MIQPPDEAEARSLVSCWYATGSTMPTQVNILKTGVEFAWCERLRISIEYGDLFQTEREAIDAARKARSQRIDMLHRDIEKLDKRIAEIE
jgi:hypothetical protein